MSTFLKAVITNGRGGSSTAGSNDAGPAPQLATPGKDQVQHVDSEGAATGPAGTNEADMIISLLRQHIQSLQREMSQNKKRHALEISHLRNEIDSLGHDVQRLGSVVVMASRTQQQNSKEKERKHSEQERESESKMTKLVETAASQAAKNAAELAVKAMPPPQAPRAEVVTVVQQAPKTPTSSIGVATEQSYFATSEPVVSAPPPTVAPPSVSVPPVPQAVVTSSIGVGTDPLPEPEVRPAAVLQVATPAEAGIALTAVPTQRTQVDTAEANTQCSIFLTRSNGAEIEDEQGRPYTCDMAALTKEADRVLAAIQTLRSERTPVKSKSSKSSAKKSSSTAVSSGADPQPPSRSSSSVPLTAAALSAAASTPRKSTSEPRTVHNAASSNSTHQDPAQPPARPQQSAATRNSRSASPATQQQRVVPDPSPSQIRYPTPDQHSSNGGGTTTVPSSAFHRAPSTSGASPSAVAQPSTSQSTASTEGAVPRVSSTADPAPGSGSSPLATSTGSAHLAGSTSSAGTTNSATTRTKSPGSSKVSPLALRKLGGVVKPGVV